MTRSTQPHEVAAWLGDGWTDEQVEQVTAEYLAWERGEPDADPALREAVLTAIAQRVDGTLDLPAVARRDLGGQIRAHRARTALRAAVIAAVAGGMSESEAARQAGVTRMTVRQWIGK